MVTVVALAVEMNSNEKTKTQILPIFTTRVFMFFFIILLPDFFIEIAV
jgi:hypothetical protein